MANPHDGSGATVRHRAWWRRVLSCHPTELRGGRCERVGALVLARPVLDSLKHRGLRNGSAACCGGVG